MTDEIKALSANQLKLHANIDRLNAELNINRPCSLPNDVIGEIADSLVEKPCRILQLELSNLHESVNSTLLRISDSAAASIVDDHTVPLSVELLSAENDAPTVLEPDVAQENVNAELNAALNMESISTEYGFDFRFMTHLPVSRAIVSKRKQKKRKKKKQKDTNHAEVRGSVNNVSPSSSPCFSSAPESATEDVTHPELSELPNEHNPTHCWMYLSGFNNLITTEQVLNFARFKLNCPDIQGHLLLPRGTNKLSRRRLAFKLKIPVSLEPTALDKSLWPSQILVRRFTHSKDFTSSRQGQRHPQTPVQKTSKSILLTLKQMSEQLTSLLRHHDMSTNLLSSQ